MLNCITFILVCFFVYGNNGLRSEFNSKKEAEEYMEKFMVYYDHLKGGNVNENFEFIQFYISKDFVYCFGGECTEGRDKYIESLNSYNKIVKDSSFQADVRNYGKKYLSLYILQTVTFLNDEVFTLPSEATFVLNDDGKLKYWIYAPNNQKYIDQFNKILEDNAGVQIKDDL